MKKTKNTLKLLVISWGIYYGFTGRYKDVETSLWYFRARYFSDELGRFISRDPLGYVDGMSLYAGYFAAGFGLDPWGLEVRVKSRNLQGPGGTVGSHTFVEVTDSSGERTTYSGLKDQKTGKLDIQKDYDADKNPSAKRPITDEVVVPPPSGMDQDEWDQKVKETAEEKIEKEAMKKDYSLFGGDGGKKSGNCHVVASDIIEDSGGEIPYFDPKGANPGLRTEKPRRKGGRAGRRR